MRNRRPCRCRGRRNRNRICRSCWGAAVATRHDARAVVHDASELLRNFTMGAALLTRVAIKPLLNLKRALRRERNARLDCGLVFHAVPAVGEGREGVR